MNIYKALYISIIWLLLFLFISLVFLILGIRLPETEKSGTCKHAAYRCLTPFSEVPTERLKRFGEMVIRKDDSMVIVFSRRRDRRGLGRWLLMSPN